MKEIIILLIIQISLKGNTIQPLFGNPTPLDSNQFGPIFSQSTVFPNIPLKPVIPEIPQISMIAPVPDIPKVKLPIGLPGKIKLPGNMNCIELKGMSDFKDFNNQNEFKDFGSPSDLIPIAWFSVWNQLRSPSNGTMSVIHASSRGENNNKEWRFVFKIQDEHSTVFYGVLANFDLDVKKHIGTEDLNDIKVLFSLPNLDVSSVLNIPFQKEALLHNSPFIPNPDYDPDLDDIDIEKLVENELNNSDIKAIQNELIKIKKEDKKLSEKEKKLESEEKKIKEEKNNFKQRVNNTVELLGASHTNDDHKEENTKQENHNQEENIKKEDHNMNNDHNDVNSFSVMEQIKNQEKEIINNTKEIKQTKESKGEKINSIIMKNGENMTLTTEITEPKFNPMYIKTFPIENLPAIASLPPMAPLPQFGNLNTTLPNFNNLATATAFTSNTNGMRTSFSSFDVPFNSQSVVTLGNDSNMDY
jgi:hypothetical protein